MDVDSATPNANTPTTAPITNGHNGTTSLEMIEALSLSAPRLPPELAALIVQHLYETLLPPADAFPSPNPYLDLVPTQNPLAKPFFAPSPIELAWETLRRLALVDKTWGALAQRYLWQIVKIGMPKGFEGIVRTIREYQSGDVVISRTSNQQEDPGASGWSLWNQDSGGDGERGRGRSMSMSVMAVEEDKWAKMSGSGRKDGMMIDDPSIEDRAPVTIEIRELPPLNPLDCPLLFTKIISFSRFRTAGLRRSGRQGSHERFVTAQRLLSLLRGTRTGGPLAFPVVRDDDFRSESESELDEDEEVIIKGKLEAVGMTEFMDSAISRSVLEEMLFRGGYLAEYEEIEEPPLVEPHGFHGGRSYHHSHLAHQTSSSETPFRHRQLQSSLSPVRGRTSHALEEHREEDEEEDDDQEEEDDRPRGRHPRPTAPRMERRASGSAFAPADPHSRDASEERGRDRFGRDVRRGRALLPPSAFTMRSSSVPTPFLQRRTTSHSLPRRLSVDPSERSSSVPASARGSSPPKKITQILEGSTSVHAIRALDLCGCVSSHFVAGLAELISAYHLGPPGLFAAASSAITTISEADVTDDEDSTVDGRDSSGFMEDAGRKLRRVLFPHLRRLGLASSLLPSPHLTALVLSFPFLTHLDLSSTLTAPVLLKNLAVTGQSGPGGRVMRLKALSLARCRLMTGAALVGFFCGDCPPFTSMAGLAGDHEEERSWGSGEVVSELVDLSLYGDGTYPSPLSSAELKLVLTISPAFLSGRLRSLDLSSTPLTDTLLADSFPALPLLIELGLAHCRNITMAAVSTLLQDKTPGVEVLDLAHSCPTAVVRSASAQRRAVGAQTPISIIEFHSTLLGRVATVQRSSYDAKEAEEAVKLRKTNLRVVELDEKTLEAVKGGAGDWKVIWGKGRRGWYVDTGVDSRPSADPYSARPRELFALSREDPTRRALVHLSELNGVVSGDVGWHARKMEVLKGDGLMGREDGLYVFHAYQV